MNKQPIKDERILSQCCKINNGVLNYTRYEDHYKKNGIFLFILSLIITFISASVSTFVLISLLKYLTKKKQSKIEKQLDEDEENNM